MKKLGGKTRHNISSYINLNPVVISERFENHRFFQLAVLLDRIDCLKDIHDLRCQMTDLITSPLKLKQNPKLLIDLREEITFLAHKYSRPASYETAMLSAVIYGRVWLKDYKPVGFKIYNSKDTSNFPPGVELTIVLDQFTTKAELDCLFVNEYKKNLRKLFQYIPKGLSSPLYEKYKTANNVANIKRDRVRFWRNIRGESYAEIAFSELNEEQKLEQNKQDNRLTDVPGVDGVIRSIQRYKKLLTVDM